MEAVEARLEQLDQNISQMDDRCRRTEDMMSMLLHSLTNSSAPSEGGECRTRKMRTFFDL